MMRTGKWVGFLGAFVVFGCGSGDPGGGGGDAGGNVGGDAAIVAASTFEASIRGAQNRTLSYTHAGTTTGQYVSCVTDGVDFFSISAAQRAGGDEGVRLALQGYRGPGAYSFTYHEPGYRDFTASVSLGAYSYDFLLDSDPTGATTMTYPSSCTITVDDTSTEDRATGTVDCTAFPANITSSDYLRSPRTMRQPTISFTATFDCAI